MTCSSPAWQAAERVVDDAAFDRASSTVLECRTGGWLIRVKPAS